MAEEYYGDTPYTDSELEELMLTGQIPYNQELLDKQRAQAESLRRKEGPQMYGNSRIQTAASPLEFLAHGVEQYQADKELARIDEAYAKLGDKAGRASKIVAGALRRKPFRMKPEDYEDELSMIPMPGVGDY